MRFRLEFEKQNPIFIHLFDFKMHFLMNIKTFLKKVKGTSDGINITLRCHYLYSNKASYVCLYYNILNIQIHLCHLMPNFISM